MKSKSAEVLNGFRKKYDRYYSIGDLTPTVCELFGIEKTRLADFVEFDPGYAIKFTINRLRPSGSFGEGDVFGCQQYAPLLDVEIPVEE